jgi:hypothetical protein
MMRIMEWSGDTPEEAARVINDNQDTYGNVVGLPGPGCDVGWWKRVSVELARLGWSPWQVERRPRLRYPMERLSK